MHIFFVFEQVLNVNSDAFTEKSMFAYIQVTNAMNAQPNILDDVNIVIPQFLKIFHTMHERCMTSLQVISFFFYIYIVFTHYNF